MRVRDYIADFAIQIAKDDRYGYSNKFPDNKFFEGRAPFDGDCGAFCSACLNAGLKQIGINTNEYFEPQGGYSIYNEAYLLKYCDRFVYENVTGLERGDILVSGGHTGMITGINPNMITHASNNYDGKTGDSSGLEIRTQALYSGGWRYVYRVKNIYNKEITEGGFDVSLLWDVRRGIEGGHVMSLQALLNQKNNAGLLVDGYCGEITEQAIKDYQAKNKLYVDGVCGAKTWFSILTLDIR